MARMIPASCDAASSKGEKQVFQALAKKCPSDWIVLHSFDLAKHVSQVNGEIDFVVIIPFRGVLVLEVKGSTEIEFDPKSGVWTLGNKVEKRGPFKQASNAMYSLQKGIKDLTRDFDGVVFSSAVVFPLAPFKLESLEWQKWQIIDEDSFIDVPLSDTIRSTLAQAHAHLVNTNQEAIVKSTTSKFNESECNKLAKLLRPNFEYFEKISDVMGKNKRVLKALTARQYDALDGFLVNDRVAVFGPAGTGKTVIATELFRRKRNEGKNPVLLCFNSLLGVSIRRHIAESIGYEAAKNVGTLHSKILEISGLSYSAAPGFWHKAHEKALERLVAEPIPAARQFDFLIIDEAQDILNGDYLDFLDLILVGGLKHGSWAFFADFEKQAIFNEGGRNWLNEFKSRGIHLFAHNLRENCRNTQSTAAFAEVLGELKPGYSRVLTSEDGMPPVPHFYKNMEQQAELVSSILKLLERQGFEPHQIVLLSCKTDAMSIAGYMTKGPWKSSMRPFSEGGTSSIRYTSVFAFKGMESPVILLTDIEEIEGSLANDLFYIGATRSTVRLYVFMHEKVAPKIAQIIGRINELGGKYVDTE